MDLSNDRVKQIVLITFGVLMLIMLLLNITRYLSSLPGYTPTVYPTAVPNSQSQHEDIFPTLKPVEVQGELQEILNKRAELSPIETEAVSSISANLILHPYRGGDFEVTYSPILNLFFIRKRSGGAEPALKDFFSDPVLYNMYINNDRYRLFVITRSNVEFARYAFERQFSEITSRIQK
ncbi:hypothetical protein HYS00_05615 [Candidatus Microgenomates bacterium]|nr:hypothetical protein [Candidatus Microgenomates bacterium]